MALLEQDFVTVPGQNYALLSVVGPDSNQVCEKQGVKIRGVFATRDEAASHAKRLHKQDNSFDIYVVDMYKWLLIPPPKGGVEDTHYQNEQLEQIISEYKANQEEGRAFFEKRKKALMTGELDPSDENAQFYNKPEEEIAEHPAEKLEKLKLEYPDKTEKELVDIMNQSIGSSSSS